MKPEAKKNSFGKGPWEMKKAEVETFVKVTPINLANAKVIGRIFYVIEKAGSRFNFLGTFTIDPCLLKGWWQWPFMPHHKAKTSHYRVFVDVDGSRDEWTENYRFLINSHLEKEQLYIKPSDPILTYIKE